MGSEVGWYLYAFFSHGEVPPMTGIDGHSPLNRIDEQGIVALASHVPLAEFGEEALRRNVEDLGWLEEKVRLHEAIVEAALAKGQLLPMKFGTIFLDPERIREVIRKNALVLRAALEELGDKEEWGVKGFVDGTGLRTAVLQNDPVLVALSGEASPKPPGHAFFHRRKIEEAASAKSQEREASLVREAVEAIRKTVVGVAECPPLPPAATREKKIVLNLACLVRKNGVADFLARVEQWSRDHAEEGMSLVASGPWPPYHFVPRLDADG
jgi:hypothetical protein